MSDRELIERAARALGWRVASYSETGTSIVPGGTAVVVAEGRTFGWRPLTDDADALRLAVALHHTVDITSHGAVVWAWITVQEEPYRKQFVETWMEHGEDRTAATRRAIVCAAAAADQTP